MKSQGGRHSRFFSLKTAWIAIGVLAAAEACLAVYYYSTLPPSPPVLSKREREWNRLTYHLVGDTPFEDTSRELEKYLVTYPEATHARREAVDFYMKNRRPESALPHVRKLAEASPEDVEILLLYGDAARETGEPLEAVHAYRKVQKLSPRNVRAIKGMGLAYRALGDALISAHYLERALLLDPSDAELRGLVEELKAELAQARDRRDGMDIPGGGHAGPEPPIGPPFPGDALHGRRGPNAPSPSGSDFQSSHPRIGIDGTFERRPR